MNIRDRIVDFRRVRASSLLPNPANWRTHPPAQQDALRGLLAEIGYANALIARELPGGRLMLIDGHLRAETTPDQLVPVLVLDVDEEEAKKLLATLDPLGALAEADAAKLDALLKEVQTDSPAVAQMLNDLGDEKLFDFMVTVNPGLTDPDDVPEPPDEAVTKPGDLWVLGEHRLLCGDSSKAEDVDRLVGGRGDSFGVHGPAVQRESRTAEQQRDRGRAELVRQLRP
jgi:hypothetical protein